MTSDIRRLPYWRKYPGYLSMCRGRRIEGAQSSRRLHHSGRLSIACSPHVNDGQDVDTWMTKYLLGICMPPFCQVSGPWFPVWKTRWYQGEGQEGLLLGKPMARVSTLSTSGGVALAATDPGPQHYPYVLLRRTVAFAQEEMARSATCFLLGMTVPSCCKSSNA